MSETLGRAVLALTTDDSGLKRGLAAAEGETRRSMADIGKSMAAIGGVMTATITTPLVAFGTTAVAAYRDSQEALGQMRAALASMGPVAGRTEEQLVTMAQTMERTLAVDADQVLRKVTTNLLTFGNISGEAFDRATKAAVDLSARLGTDMQGSAIMLGRALNDPIRGIAALQRVGVAFTEQQREQITAMVEAGDTAGAQALILSELERQYGGQAAALAESSLGTRQLALAWESVQERVGEVIAKVLPQLMAKLNGVLTWVASLDGQTLTWIVAIAGVAAALGPVIAALGLMVTGIAAAVGAVGSIVAAIGTAITVLGKLGVAIKVLLVATGPIGMLILAAGLLTAAWLKWGDQITAIVSRAAAAIRTAFTNVRDWLFNTLTDLDARASAAIRGAFAAVSASVTRLFAAVGDTTGRAAAALTATWRAWGSTVAGVVTEAAAAIRTTLTAVRDFVAGAFARMAETVTRPFTAMIDAARNAARVLVGNSIIPDMVRAIDGWLARLVQGTNVHMGTMTSTMIGAGQTQAQSMSGAWGTILGEFDRFTGGWISRLHGWAQRAVDILGVVGRVAGSIGRLFGGGGGGGLGGILGGIGQIVGGGGGGILGTIGNVVGAVRGIGSAIGAIGGGGGILSGIGGALAAVPGIGLFAAGAGILGGLLGGRRRRRRRRREAEARAAAEAAARAQAEAEQRALDAQLAALPTLPPLSAYTPSAYHPAQPEAPASPPVERTLTVVGLKPDELWTGKMVRALAEKLIDFQHHGGRIVLEPA